MGEKKRANFFVDRTIIKVEAGRGGDGMMHFRREKYVPKGGPDGGDGGRGGSVYAIGKKSLKTLLDLKYKSKYKAMNGADGGTNRKQGKKGQDIYIPVPLGTIFLEDTTNEFIGEILKDKETLLLASGGRGGRGNTRFATPVMKSPRKYEKGESGEEKLIRVELKLIAEIGVVGFPNSGKSTLLKALTGTNVKTAGYAFTTLTPNLGVMNTDRGEQVVICDLPGIVKDASLGRGMGLQFLRHIERTLKLIFLIDITAADPVQQVSILKGELKAYNKSLLDKPRIIVFNKIDLVDNVPEFDIPGERVYYISAIKKQNLDLIKQEIKKWQEQTKKQSMTL